MKAIYILITMLFADTAHSQSCMYRKLSEKYDFKASRTNKGNNSGDSIATIRVYIYRKDSNKLVQKIKLVSDYLFDNDYLKCGEVRSYITGYKTGKDIVDFDFGDLVVADLNFDGNEDLALKADAGGNAGPLYNFYLQRNDGTFELDTFLTREMIFFPDEISAEKKTLTTITHANAVQLCKTVFQLNTGTGKWEKIKSTLINIK